MWTTQNNICRTAFHGIARWTDLVYDAVLSNDATLENGKGIGDPTEYALLEMFRKIPAPKGGMMGEGGYREEMLRSCMKRLEEGSV